MEDKKVSCSVCAWVATCKKQFLMKGDSALHCADFTFDVSLKKKSEKKDDEKSG